MTQIHEREPSLLSSAGDLDAKVEEGPHLRRRVMPRRIERVERERLVRPAREEIDQPTALEQVSDAEGKHLRDAGAREARLQHRSDVGEQKRALCIDRGDLTPALQLPLERATGGTAEVYAGMTFDIGRPLGYSVSVRRYTGAETVRTRVSRNSRLIM